MNLKTLLALVAVVAVGIISACYLLSIYNAQALDLNLYNAKVKANEADFDNMWKTISQTAQVADKAKDALHDIFTDYANARSGNGGTPTPDQNKAVMNWIKESVPNPDISTIDHLQNIIMGAREDWTTHQKELVNIAKEYNDNLVVMPKGFILHNLMGFAMLDAKVITSTRTDNAFQTEKDDDVTLPASPATK